MRNAFADEISKLAESDPRIVMLSSDIGNRLFDKYKEKHPGRFYNTGVAEANTISMAAGLAAVGMRPICYTITPFITSRCYEQIKVDVCYHDKPVVIVGTGSGLSYASLGATHHSLEDIAIMRALPGIRVLAPADASELRSCLRVALSSDCPNYIRIGKKNEPIIFEEPPGFEYGKWQQIQDGEKICLLSTGTMLPEVTAAADAIAKAFRKPAVWACASIKPLDEAQLARLFKAFAIVATVEEHGRVGGFGAAVAEWLVDQRDSFSGRLIRFATPDEFLHESGEQEHARKLLGLTGKQIAASLLDVCDK